jgi:hypothetical protein
MQPDDVSTYDMYLGAITHNGRAALCDENRVGMKRHRERTVRHRRGETHISVSLYQGHGTGWDEFERQRRFQSIASRPQKQAQANVTLGP